MKKVLIALPVLLMALFFAFCTKSNVKEELSATTETAVSDRGNCTIEVFTDNAQSLQFCGTNSNLIACQTCPGGNGRGQVAINGHGFVNVVSPITFSVNNPNLTGTWVQLTTGGSTTAWTFIPGGGCQAFTLDNNCNF